MVLTISLSDVVFCSCTRAWYTDGGRCLLLWIQIRGGIVVRAADCRSAGSWFNSGWRSWFIFMTGSDNLMNHPAQRYNTMSPIRTVITTITRKSVNMVAELDYDTASTLGSSIPSVSVWRATLQQPRLLRRLQWRWTHRPVQHSEQLFN